MKKFLLYRTTREWANSRGESAGCLDETGGENDGTKERYG